MKSNKCVILIPIYKEKIDFYEYNSIQNIINLYNDKYDIFFMCERDLNTYNYNKLFNIEYKKYNYKGEDEYSYTLLDKNFYKEYLCYDYMLIAQTDTYIFNGNLLEYYINKEYSYIGALFFICDHGYDNIRDNIIKNLYENNCTVKDLKKFINNNSNLFNYTYNSFVMNGGLSLRRIDLLYHLFKYHKLHGPEDFDISNLLYDNDLLDNILIKDIVKFSVEYYLLDIYQKYNIIPFGSHKTYIKFIENIIQ